MAAKPSMFALMIIKQTNHRFTQFSVSHTQKSPGRFLSAEYAAYASTPSIGYKAGRQTGRKQRRDKLAKKR